MEHGGVAMTESSGSYGEPRAGAEAAKLLAAAQDWLRTSAPHLAPVDDEGATCPCPVCRAVAGVREADPDAVGRWVDAALAAATSVLAQAGEKLAPTAGADGGSDDAADDDGYATDVADADAADDDVDDDLADDDEDPEGADRQDERGARGVRRIPLEQTEPGDLDG